MDINMLQQELDRRIGEYQQRLGADPATRLLLDRHNLRDKITHAQLADGLPTPITTLETDSGMVWVKRDDLTSSLYGGNKVRKLEYVLADVARRGCVPVIVGATASHQVLASVVFSRLLGIRCEVVLFPQPPTPQDAIVKSVLDAFDIRVHRASTPYRSPWATARALAGWRRRRRLCLVYPGSSSPAGTLGYVECGLEIADAVRSGICPEPDVVYTAFGTGGTSVGLAMGLKLGGLSSKVCAVRVGEPIVSNLPHLRIIEWRARRLLGSLGVDTSSAIGRISLETAFRGKGYGHSTAEAEAAAELAVGAGLPIDLTYTAKALAATLDQHGQGPSRNIMFLETLAAENPVPARDALD